MAGYREIADHLRAAIDRGEYRPGDTIPKLEELEHEWGVGKETVRRAVAVLRAEGLVLPIRRRGTVVRDRTPVRLTIARHRDVIAAPGSLGPWETACAQQGLQGRTDLIEVSDREATANVAALLEIPTGALAVRRLQHMSVSDQVAQIQETWLPLAVARGTALESPSKLVGGIYRALIALGLRPATASETTASRMPTQEEATTMHLDLGSPVMAIDRVTRDRQGTVLLVARAVVVGDRVTLTYDETFPEE